LVQSAKFDKEARKCEIHSVCLATLRQPNPTQPPVKTLFLAVSAAAAAAVVVSDWMACCCVPLIYWSASDDQRRCPRVKRERESFITAPIFWFCEIACCTCMPDGIRNSLFPYHATSLASSSSLILSHIQKLASSSSSPVSAVAVACRQCVSAIQ
jgi:hypothetical protein